MAIVPWTNDGPTLSKFSFLKVKSTVDDLVDLSSCEDVNNKEVDHNQRFLDALRDGGIWLS